MPTRWAMPTSLRKTTAADSSPSSGVRTQERGSIVIDLVDAGDERLGFRGVAFDMVSEEGRPLPAPPAGEQLGRAKELVRDGRIDEAIALYREILAQNPSNLKARNNLGVLYDELGSLDLALEQFEAAELIEPENVELRNNYGSILGAMGRYDEAADLLRCAQRLEADNILVHFLDQKELPPQRPGLFLCLILSRFLNVLLKTVGKLFISRSFPGNESFSEKFIHFRIIFRDK